MRPSSKTAPSKMHALGEKIHPLVMGDLKKWETLRHYLVFFGLGWKGKVKYPVGIFKFKSVPHVS